MKRWRPVVVEAKPSNNELLPGSRSRGAVGILVVDGYRKVVLAIAQRTRRHGTFFTSA
ncbi:MAG TPA: hypothetical protein VE935_15595 [Burkholderiales bacterium]|nr:hypothetical protein [Burkholderiales bacterium]